ncbi:hypothetical protein PHYBOEH_005483 [Phytophthora boehmeriae]|uniref:Protein kinase domain-containing protein n=1 Tax=Phytophthora boehmeriae TaxID=109152 RepID=A0A8T1WPG3_9STRA|nr:hypothetical protein PHYBOEH_005483 [Phytophthora boehmeriae]
MVPIPDSLTSERRSWPSARTSQPSSRNSLDYKKWGNVKTWTFAQLLASSFAKVKLQDGGKPSSSSSNNDLKSAAKSDRNKETKAPSSGKNDWDCSYSCLSTVVPPPTISASSSSSTILSDLDMHHRHSLEDLLQHEETVEEEDPAACRDLTRYVFDIVRIIGSGSYGTVLLCRLRACPSRLFAVKVVYKSKLGSINGLDGDRNASREANRLLTEKKQVEGHLVYEERDLQGFATNEEEDHFYFPDFDWCAEPSHFQ